MLGKSHYDTISHIFWVSTRQNDDNLQIDIRGLVLQILFFYAPLLVALIFNFVVYHKAIVLTKQFYVNHERLQSSLIRKLRRFPLALVICFTPELAYRAYSLYDPEPICVLSLLTAAAGSSIGLLNTLIYGEEILKILSQDPCCGPFIRCFCCCCKISPDSDSFISQDSIQNSADVEKLEPEKVESEKHNST
eukprot:TRINITY_DN5973_c0_g1_i1.p1 TRINITY_DN5973_c0_g1~~TRINITY_DN5973_c0_g1_i1.p1  ORF type:complete len:192 (-),score=20.51 TRINITY_DN5973_c0_g1_i1:151-726(-)